MKDVIRSNKRDDHPVQNCTKSGLDEVLSDPLPLSSLFSDIGEFFPAGVPSDDNYIFIGGLESESNNKSLQENEKLLGGDELNHPEAKKKNARKRKREDLVEEGKISKEEQEELLKLLHEQKKIIENQTDLIGKLYLLLKQQENELRKNNSDLELLEKKIDSANKHIDSLESISRIKDNLIAMLMPNNNAESSKQKKMRMTEKHAFSQMGGVNLPSSSSHSSASLTTNSECDVPTLFSSSSLQSFNNGLGQFTGRNNYGHNNNIGSKRG